MSSIDITKLRNRWLGIWSPATQYVTNDVVQWRGSSYVCIRDLPAEQIIVADTGINTNSYQAIPSTLTFRSIDPTNAIYWVDMAPGMAYKRTWSPRTTYTTGDIVELGGDLYICVLGGIRNTYVLDTRYWTKIFENSDRDQRYVVADFMNQQPLGWTRNMGDVGFQGGSPGYTHGFLGHDGNVYLGGYLHQGSGTGASMLNTYGVSGWKTACFTFVDWLLSTDNGGSGTFTTPDGLNPRCIQWVHNGTSTSNYGNSLYVMNNGELYASGYNAQGQLGVATSDTTTRNWPVRVTNAELIDWWGNAIPQSFNNTKIIKAAQSSQGMYNTDANSCFALGDDGSVWAWGYNAYGQLGLGPNQAATNSIGTGETNQTKPQRIPQSFFDHKKIVDIYSRGGNYGWTFAIDEDGYLWGWGVDPRGALGLADRHASVVASALNRQYTPVRIGIDWNKHGGIKKIIMGGQQAGTYQWTFILDGDGYLWTSGEYVNNSQNRLYNMSNYTTSERSAKFTRMDKNWYSEHSIENFWVVGSSDWNIIIREKGTGLTYIWGGNEFGHLGSSSNRRDSGSAYTMFPTAVRGVRYVKDATPTHCGDSAYTTFLCVTDDGEVWGMGDNNYGSLAWGSAGDTSPTNTETEDQGSNQYWRRALLPPGTTITGVYGFGHDSYDGSMFITDTGGYMLAGFDGDGIGYHTIQGHINTYAFQETSSNPGSSEFHTMHSYPG
jgi:alpha-tubulin suppressor-like RCC1 family protein